MGGGREPARDPVPVRQSLEQVARALGGPSAEALGAVFSRWEEMVGAEVAAHSRPLSLVQGVLVVGVDEPIWRTQLTYLEGDLKARVEAVVGPGTVDRIEVRVRPRKAGTAHPGW